MAEVEQKTDEQRIQELMDRYDLPESVARKQAAVERGDTEALRDRLESPSEEPL